jgi:hypothetical protein
METTNQSSGATTAGNSPLPRSPPRSPEVLQDSPRPSSSPRVSTAPSSPGVMLTAPDGRKVIVPSSVLRAALPEEPTHGQLFIWDSGWQGVDMVTKLAKQGYASIVHIKNSFAGYPKDELEEQLRGMPGGSHLEMKSTVDGVNLIAIGSKYNSKKTVFHLACEGAAPTSDGVAYTTKWPDENGNVLTREVSRPALVSRYFMNFNKVDIHDQLRQHELGLESKWVRHGEKAGKFRIMSTIMGVTAIDTMLAIKSHSHETHSIRTKSTKEFIELLAEEMIDNELDGCVSRPLSKKRVRHVTEAVEMPEEGATHQLQHIGRLSEARPLKAGEKNQLIQLRCTVCNKKTSTFCTKVGCGQSPVCNSTKRRCFQDHCTGDFPVDMAKRRKSKMKGRRASI